MAVANAFRAAVMPDLEVWFGNLVEASSSRIIISDGSRQTVYTGSFTYSPAGGVFGTLNGVTQSRDGSLIYSVTGANANANAVYNAVQIQADFALAASIVFASADTLNGSGESDYLRAYAGDDNLAGNGGSDTLDGGEGNDLLYGGLGDDVIAGSGGTDTAVFLGTVNTTVNLSNSAAQNTGHGLDRFLLTENVTTAGGSDRLTGDDVRNVLRSGAGSDVLDGGLGRDLLIGGFGRDAFVFSTAPGPANVDRISDFSVADDTIRLDIDVFAGLTGLRLTATAFRANETGLAEDATDRVIYDSLTGNLFFDVNGSRPAGRVLFAVVAPELDLTHLDFALI